MTKNPYTEQPNKAFWRSAVADVSPLELQEVYRPRFDISAQTRISAAGSCFAQYIGAQFKHRGFNFVDLEPAPAGLPENKKNLYGFDLYSARYGNIYSIRQLRQLFERATGTFEPKEDVWRGGERFFDPFRPSIEPDGFASEEELETDRRYHLSVVRTLFEVSDLFVFTFGLTEAWICRSDGAVLPTCPGTVAGEFDANLYQFHNFTYPEILEDTEAVIRFARKCNENIRFLFTVSPVPLTATATNEHVLIASVYSKSVLRAVCGELVNRYDFVDYFPSYELVASHPMRAVFFEPNLRNASAKGVSHVMDTFFGSLDGASRKPGAHPEGRGRVKKFSRRGRGRVMQKGNRTTVCDEEILEEFGE